MNGNFEGLGFGPAEILLPRDCDLSLWAVVACDQYTSQPEYWQRVDERVGGEPSALRLILPESKLEGPGVETDILDINNVMSRYLREGRFCTLPDALIYVERRLEHGRVRRGLVGMIDLEEYDYEPGSPARVRATEGTVLSRIPPRVKVRKNAPIELPHVMLLADDPGKTLIEPLADGTDEMELLYDFELMEGGGHITGRLLSREQMEQAARALQALADPAAFRAKYGTKDEAVLLFAAGDGNHSLATAKECYERQKRLVPPEVAAALPARYALCEVVNLHDDALTFEPIHRVVFGVNPRELLDDLLAAYPGAYEGEGPGHTLPYAFGEKMGVLTVPRPKCQLPVGTLQEFLDEWLSRRPEARIDYIHGRDVACGLAAGEGAVAFLLPAMEKDTLFPTVIHDGVLPRKTFSMGEAEEKRFYLEARKIRV